MPAHKIMIQGTSFYVGKNVVTASLCRHFRREGFRVAPFKAQNMSNNSYADRETRTSVGDKAGLRQVPAAFVFAHSTAGCASLRNARAVESAPLPPREIC
jgi:cobyric acid synthase